MIFSARINKFVVSTIKKGFTLKRELINVKHGFTLIELLIVIAILGILAAAVLVAVNPAKRQNQAKDANIKADIGSIATAAQAYYTQPGAGSYPDTDAPDSGLTKLVTNGDLKQLPTPTGGGNYNTNYGATGPGFPPSVACDPYAAVPVLCGEAYVYWPLNDAAVTGNVWCWESIEGRAEEETIAACTDWSAAT